MGKRVVVGLSGGVDSSVAALLLKQQGYTVIGMFMRNWNDASVTLEEECPWIDDSRDAMLIAEQIGIPFQVVDLSEEYKTRIVDYMFEEYAAGRTPNPDVLCNREVKFDLFLKKALSLGAEFVATGHYVQKAECQQNNQTYYQLLAGADPNKDQSYFLCQINQYQLSHALFPIGHLQKPEVRKIAEENGLVTAGKRDSQGLCFIGKVSLPEFLQQQLKTKKGNVIEISETAQEIEQYYDACKQTTNPAIWSEGPLFTADSGTVIGEHNGAHFYTIGQRRGLHIGGKLKPLFVLQTNVHTNTVYVGQGEEHPGLFRFALYIENKGMHWVRPDLILQPGELLHVMTRIRYRQKLQPAVIKMTENRHYLVFEKPMKGVTSGQFAACYVDNELVCSGVIA